MPETLVNIALEGNVARIQINRPEALNALNKQLIEELERCVTLLESKPEIGVVVLESTGDRAFVAGADIKEMQEMNPEQAYAMSKFGSQTFTRLANLPCVVVARVQGFALGGGLELALTADIIICADTAQLGLPETSLGLIPGYGGTQRLQRKIGMGRAMEWMVTANRYSAAEAMRVGLVNQVVPLAELDTAVDKIIVAMAKNAPSALKAVKAVTLIGSEMKLESGLDLESKHFSQLFGTPEPSLRIAKFLNKTAVKK